MKVGVVGLGKLGLPLSLVLAKSGFNVCGIDVDKERLREIKRSNSKFSEPRVSEYLQTYANFKFSPDYQMLSDAPVVIVITQTPSHDDGHFDIGYVEKATREIHNVNEDALIVVSSNIGVGSIDKLSAIHKKICYNPEFIAQGTIIKDFENPKFVIVGAYTKEDGEQVADMWRQVHKNPIYVVKPIEAEIIKLALNFSYSIGITFANMIGELCEKFGASSSMILEIMYQDRRNYKAGLGFGGPCFPRDVKNFKTLCKENSVKSGLGFARLLNNLNDYTVDRYCEKIKSYKKKKVGILGIAYKPNVPYIYNSQSLNVAQQLEREEYEIYIYDLLAQENAKKVLDKAHFCTTLAQCIQRADVLFIGTPNYSGTKSDKPVINPWA